MKIAVLESNVYPIPSPNDVISAPHDLEYELINKLIQRKYDISVFASKDSKISKKLYSENLFSLYYQAKKNNKEFHLNSPFDVELAHAYENILTSKLYKLAQEGKFDLIHANPLSPTLHYSRLTNVPTVFTLHIPLKALKFGAKNEVTHLDYQMLLLNYYKHVESNYFVSISDNQRLAMPDLNYIATVYHGVNLREYSFSVKNQNHLAMLGRIVKEKGFKTGLKIAQITQKQIKIAGKYSTTRSDYWFKEIKPLLKKINGEYLGIIKGEKKNRFYQEAKAFLFPLQWEEPFGMTMIESMACGTPVIAFARGSVSEVMKDGKTGFIINSSEKDKRGSWTIKRTGMEGMIEAVKKIYAMPENEYHQMRANCRKHVEEYFTVEKMIDGYEKVYQKVLNNRKNKKI